MNRNEGAFTLIELIVVVLIIGLLAGIVVPRLAGIGPDTRITVTRANLQAIEQVLERYHLDHGRYPERLEDIPKSYQKDPPRDAWERMPVYRLTGDKESPYELFSLAADGVEGGAGEGADIRLR